MESKYLPLLMMALFLIVVIGGRIGAQLVSVGDSGIRSATRLRTIRAVFISLLMFGTLIVQLLLSLLYAAAVLEPHIALGKVATWTGLALCLSGILFAIYS